MDGLSCPGVCLLISDAFHKAFISVDEEGTEAAAATGVVTVLESGIETLNKVVVDRIFLIRDRTTDAILFVGRVEDPIAQRLETRRRLRRRMTVPPLRSARA